MACIACVGLFYADVHAVLMRHLSLLANGSRHLDILMGHIADAWQPLPFVKRAAGFHGQFKDFNMGSPLLAMLMGL